MSHTFGCKTHLDRKPPPSRSETFPPPLPTGSGNRFQDPHAPQTQIQYTHKNTRLLKIHPAGVDRGARSRPGALSQWDGGPQRHRVIARQGHDVVLRCEHPDGGARHAEPEDPGGKSEDGKGASI